MTPREIFRAALAFEPAPRLPRLEWAAWWDKTIDRWESEGFPKLGWEESQTCFGLDFLHSLHADPREVRIKDEADYRRVQAELMPDEAIEGVKRRAWALAERHARGEFSIRLILEGYFWYPRRLLGIEPHLLAFYDQPALLHHINADLLEFHLKTMEAVLAILTPDMANTMEDMSYNHGPMLSQDCFEEFIRPYYLPVAEMLRKYDIPLFVDSDGQVGQLLPWLIDCGVNGIFPLERQAGVDINALRAEHPGLLMLGGFDKMVMHRGEAAVRAEFERILPLMRAGGYIPSVDHQTPPGVSLEDYRIYIRLLTEYTELGGKS